MPEIQLITCLVFKILIIRYLYWNSIYESVRFRTVIVRLWVIIRKELINCNHNVIQ